jgi:hypothetical protein
MVPNLWDRFIVKGIPNIGYTVWETTHLPDGWVEKCNKMDAIWVPSEWNVDIFKQCGVQVPVKKIEHTLDPSEIHGGRLDKSLCLPENKFIFYSIFQWNERKNPQTLIMAFLT